MTDQPLVSVVTATYNMGQYLREAMESVLAQEGATVELIVIDDGSTDPETPAVLADYEDNPRVIIVRQANAGQTVAKNAGLARARGQYVGFCDSDNVWLAGKLLRQLPIIEGSVSIGVVYGDIALMDDQGRDLPTPLVRRHEGRITGPLLADNFITFNTTLVPRRILEEMGGFDESLSMGIDYDLWLRISVKYEFRYIPEPLVRYRIWGGQMSHRTGERLDNFFRLLEKFLDRHPGTVIAADVRNAYCYTYVTRGRWHAAEGRPGAALKDYWRAFGRKPLDRRLWRSAFGLLRGWS